jgi:endonuclease/exonuclease/phosphatase family metal-dependent hydrolase
VSITIVTWNLHGSERPDVAAIGELLGGFSADVVALQEVRRAQAGALVQSLSWATVHWSFKHWPIPSPAEGLAVLSPHRLVDAETVTLSTLEPPWTYRRRIAQLCTLDVPGNELQLANAHLASDDANARRVQAERLLSRVRPDSFVVGDLNARPGGAVLRLLLDLGLRDAADTEGATNWRPGDPDDRPTNRIDYVLVPARFDLIAANVPSADDDDLTAYRRLSDHLPVRVEVETSA